MHNQKKRHEDGRQPEYSIQRETPTMLEDNSCVPNKESKHWLHRPTLSTLYWYIPTNPART